MGKRSLLAVAGAVAVMVAGLLAGCGDGKAKADPETLANLQTAFNGESNASAKYAMYAEKAEAAGYKSVGALFRAASKSESIHAAREAEVIRAMGAEPKAEIKLPEYVDVKTSLEDALKGETYEFTSMYPEFIATAQKNGSTAAVEVFQYALEAEKEHGGFYTAALADLEGWKPAGKEFFVCTVCGYTTGNPDMNVCILCGSPKDKFEIFK